MTSANDIQHGGDHYRTQGTQHWDLMAKYHVPYLEGNGSKYGYRWPKKNGLEDVEKFGHYVQKILELHLQEGYVSNSHMSLKVWEEFCVQNGVDSVSMSATGLLLTWSNEDDLLAVLDHLPEMRRRADWVAQTGEHPDSIPE